MTNDTQMHACMIIANININEGKRRYERATQQLLKNALWNKGPYKTSISLGEWIRNKFGKVLLLPLLYCYAPLWALMGPYIGPYGPMWALMGPYGPLWVLLDKSSQVRTCPISDSWSNFACFGSKNKFLTKFLDDSAWFLLEKLKKHVILTKNPNI